MKYAFFLTGLILTGLALTACAPADNPAPKSESPDQAVAEQEDAADPAPITAPAGAYVLDKTHASLVFRVNHLGFSNYTASFSSFDAALTFDPATPENMSVQAIVDVASLTLPAPPEGFHAELLSADWLNAGAHPQITYRSTGITSTGPRSARIEGELSFMGTTAPLNLEARFMGGYAGYPPYDPQARIGFTAHGTLSRSAFGMTVGLPPEGSTMGVGDTVSFQIDAEFTGPPTQEASDAEE